MSKFLPYWKDHDRIPDTKLLKEDALVSPITPRAIHEQEHDPQPPENVKPKKSSPHDEIVEFLIGRCRPIGVLDYEYGYDRDDSRRQWVNTAPSDWLDELLAICGEDPASYPVEEWVKEDIAENWDWQVANTLADWAGKDPENWLIRVLDKMDESNIEIILLSLWFVEPDFCQQFLELAWDKLPELGEKSFINLINSLGNGGISREFAFKHFSLLKEQIDPTMKEAWHELNIFLPDFNL